MTYKEFLKAVEHTERDIYVPLLQQRVLKSSFIKEGKYSKELELKFLKAVYDKRKFRQQREQEESSLFQSPNRHGNEAK